MSQKVRQEVLLQPRRHYARAGRNYKGRLRAEHARLDSFESKKTIEQKLKNFFTLLGNLNREATKR